MDTPGVVFDRGGANPKHMPNVKVIIDFTGYTAVDLGPAAQTIHDKMVENATTFPDPPIPMAGLAVLIGTFNTTLAAKASRATADVIAFNVARHELEEALGELGGYVNSVAKGSPVIAEKSGFLSYDTARVVDPSPPAAPVDLRLRHGDLTCSVVARYKPDRQRSINQVQICTSDPNVEENWKDAGLFSGGKAVISGLTPGATLWVRVRTVGIKGVMGAWSDPAKIIVV